MSVQLGTYSPVAAPAGARGTGVRQPALAVPVTVLEDEFTADVVGAAPPVAVSEQVASAARRAMELFASNRELHFAKDETSGRIIVQVRDLDGNVLRTIPPSKALAVMAGELEI